MVFTTNDEELFLEVLVPATVQCGRPKLPPEELCAPLWMVRSCSCKFKFLRHSLPPEELGSPLFYGWWGVAPASSGALYSEEHPRCHLRRWVSPVLWMVRSCSWSSVARCCVGDTRCHLRSYTVKRAGCKIGKICLTKLVFSTVKKMSMFVIKQYNFIVCLHCFLIGWDLTESLLLAGIAKRLADAELVEGWDKE